MNAKAIEYHYIDLVFPLIRELMIEALIIGIVIVAFGMLAKAAENPRALLEPLFWQRLVLLFTIMTWTSGVILTYQLYKLELDANQAPLTKSEAFALSRMTLAMVPLELAMALMICIMFGALAFRDYSKSGKVAKCLRPEISILLFVGSLVHVIWAMWFIIVFTLTGRFNFEIQHLNVLQFFIQPGTVSPALRPLSSNVNFHLSIAAVFAASLFVVRLLARTPFYKRSPTGWDWLITIIYSGFIISYYINRVGDYLASFYFKG